MQNLGTLRQLSLGDLADDGRERGRGKIMPSLMATSLRWRTHSARTNRFTWIVHCDIRLCLIQIHPATLNIDSLISQSLDCFTRDEMSHFSFTKSQI
jgi:hypothetical protein